MRSVLVAAALLLAGAACDDDPVIQADATTTLPSAAVDTVPPATPPPATPPETTTTTEDEGPPVVLRGDGLGAVRFNDQVDEVIAGLTLRWGPPGEDSGWLPAANSPFGVCPGGEVRGLEWNGFSVLFSDGPTPFGPAGRRHFFSWVYLGPEQAGNRPPLHTEAGISVGATVADLQRAYGERAELFDDPELGGPSFGIDTPNGLLNGYVTSMNPDGVVRSMIGGGGCGE